MKPGKQTWASNATYAAGPEIGNPTKQPPPPGRQVDGWEPGQPPPAAWWNHLTWAINERLNYLARARLKNLFAKVNTTPGVPLFAGGTAVELAACYRPLSVAAGRWQDFHHVEGLDSGLGVNFQTSSPGGERFAGSASGLPATASPRSGAMVSDPSGNAAIGVTGAASGLYYSAPAAPLVWTPWTGTVGDDFVAIDYDVDRGYWVGIDRANTRIESGNVLGAALTVRLTNASLTTGSNLKVSNHAPGTVYPDDPGNQVALAFGNSGTAWYRSTDAILGTWSTLAPAPFVPQTVDRDCLAYSYVGSRWGTVVSNGPATGAGNLTFAYSDDNGDNWVEINDAFEWSARGYGAWTPPATDECHLVCDGWGHWMAVYNANDGTGEDLTVMASADNGLTWNRLYLPGQDSTVAGNGMRAALWYGDGAFWIAHAGWDGAASVMDVCASIRVGE